MGIDMGLFRRRDLKNIRLEQDISLYLVFPYKTKGGHIWLNKQAIVPDGAELIFGARGKVLDILPPGQHKLTAVTLPECSKRFKLNKPDKYNHFPKTFKAQVYYVSKAVQEDFTFSTYKKMRFDNIRDGAFWVSIDFKMDFSVIDCPLFLSKLLKVYAYLKHGEAEEVFQSECSEFITDEILKDNYLLSSFTTYKENLLDVLKLKQQEFLKGWGCELIDLNYNQIHLSKNAGKNSKKFEKPSVWKGLEQLTVEKNSDKIPTSQFVDLEED